MKKGFEWAWYMDPEGDRSHILTAKVLDVGKNVKLAMTIKMAGKTLHKAVVDVHESAVPIALVAMSFGTNMPKGEFQWARSPEEHGHTYWTRTLDCKVQQRTGKVHVHTTVFQTRQIVLLGGGAIPPDFISGPSDSTALVPIAHVLQAKRKE